LHRGSRAGPIVIANSTAAPCGINMANRITNYTWREPSQRLKYARDVFDFCNAIIRIHQESGESAGAELLILQLTQREAARIVLQAGQG
jgi:hypothetical protein